MRQVCVVQINVTDMDAAIRFYCDLLGMEIKDREAYPDIVQLEQDGPVLILYRVAERGQPSGYPHRVQVVVNLQSDDLEADLARLRGHGVRVLHDEPQPCPVGRFIAVEDPSGTIIELLEFGEPA